MDWQKIFIKVDVWEVQKGVCDYLFYCCWEICILNYHEVLLITNGSIRWRWSWIFWNVQTWVRILEKKEVFGVIDFFHPPKTSVFIHLVYGTVKLCIWRWACLTDERMNVECRSVIRLKIFFLNSYLIEKLISKVCSSNRISFQS